MNEEDLILLTNILFLKEASTECQVKPLLRWISDEVENGICLLKILVTRVPKKHTGVIIIYYKNASNQLYVISKYCEKESSLPALCHDTRHSCSFGSCKADPTVFNDNTTTTTTPLLS